MRTAASTNSTGVVTNVILVDEYIPEGYQLCSDWIGVGMQIDAPQPQPALPTNEEQAEHRRIAYEKESDPIFFMAQRGEATTEQWQAKIDEIKAQYPYYFDEQGNLLEAQQ